MTQDRFGLSRGRWITINGLILLLVGLQLGVIWRGGERWPFARYSMYASEHGADIHWYRVYGVTASGEFPLDNDRYYVPIDGPRLSYSFTPRPDRRGLVRASPDDMLRTVGRLYERGRLDGRHQGPRLTGLRAYELTWTLDPQLKNREHPDGKALLAEVSAGE